uniref:Epidermal patterning factor-like protein n=1 Tax=Cicer arietinum TaxID=3827 RepID=A0A3Q7Y6P8_CICAR|nr:EPIDERMAL PATTERNING FACTOR-like protein 1 [Cicer arietinum]
MSANKFHFYCGIIFFLLSIFTTIFSNITNSSYVHIYQNVNEEIGEGVPLVADAPDLSSEPPSCINKCETCNPCEPTLVILAPVSSPSVSAPPTEMPDQPYSYPETWRCRCGDKFYPPLN